MAGFDVLGCVTAVASAFQSGAELMKVIRKRHKKRKAERDFQEKQLQQSLEQGEQQVQLRYVADHEQLGISFKSGDGQYILRRDICVAF